VLIRGYKIEKNALDGCPGIEKEGRFQRRKSMGRYRLLSMDLRSGNRPGDFLVHHAIALGLHTTTLILVKGALDARGSKLMPDKKDFGSVRWPRTRRYL
ncbi:photosystem I P700 chlorophyll A apoprotein, partial [Tanacetum coccineum]